MSTLDQAMNYLADNVYKNGGVAIRYFRKTGITLPAGTSSNVKTVSIDASSALKANDKPMAVCACLNNYTLPYYTPGATTRTWISSMDVKAKIVISNTAGAWNNYTGYFMILVVTNI